jgi:hypothetical protein
VAVFRFTLGIPGFDDSLVPRFVGGAAGALLALNHVLSPQPVSDAQASPRIVFVDPKGSSCRRGFALLKSFPTVSFPYLSGSDGPLNTVPPGQLPTGRVQTRRAHARRSLPRRPRPSPSPPPPQVRAEFLGALLVALCLVVPEIEERLRAVLPGRGRQAGADAVEGSSRVFALDGGLPEAERRELAWLSFAALKNMNVCAVALLRGADCGRAVVARGAVGSGVAAVGGGGGGGASGGGGGGGDSPEVLRLIAKVGVLRCSMSKRRTASQLALI